jgi:exopolysaccharide production protein ExoY
MAQSGGPSSEVTAGQTAKLATQRVADLVIATLAIVAVGPMMLILAVLVRAWDGGPVFYGHLRVGRMGQLFRCWKFRTMVVDADRILAEYLSENPEARTEWEAGHKLRRDPRITKLGRFLRASSLDELPQLWNVLIGEMSIVGPRPIVLAEIARYKSNFSGYCVCRPGMTGLWQISGRSDVSYDQRIALDMHYSRSRSLLLDIRILVSTIPAVIARRGSY